MRVLGARERVIPTHADSVAHAEPSTASFGFNMKHSTLKIPSPHTSYTDVIYVIAQLLWAKHLSNRHLPI
jgi:hypothetical protein